MRLVFLVLFFFLSFTQFCVAQNKFLDSLQHIISNTPNDTNKVKTFYVAARYFIRTNADTSLKIINNSLILAEKLKFKKGIGDVYYHIALLYGYQSKFDSAIKYYDKAIIYQKEIGNWLDVANYLHNKAICHQSLMIIPLLLALIRRV